MSNESSGDVSLPLLALSGGRFVLLSAQHCAVAWLFRSSDIITRTDHLSALNEPTQQKEEEVEGCAHPLAISRTINRSRALSAYW